MEIWSQDNNVCLNVLVWEGVPSGFILLQLNFTWIEMSCNFLFQNLSGSSVTMWNHFSRENQLRVECHGNKSWDDTTFTNVWHLFPHLHPSIRNALHLSLISVEGRSWSAEIVPASSAEVVPTDGGRGSHAVEMANCQIRISLSRMTWIRGGWSTQANSNKCSQRLGMLI